MIKVVEARQLYSILQFSKILSRQDFCMTNDLQARLLYSIVKARLLYDKCFTSKTILQHCTVQCSTILSSKDYCITNVLQAILLYILVKFSAVQYCPEKTIV